MPLVPRLRRPGTRTTLAVALLCTATVLTLGATANPASAKPPPPKPLKTNAPRVTGLAPVALPGASTPAKLPVKKDTITVDRNRKVRPAAAGGSASAVTAAATPATAKVALRALIVGVDSGDWGVATWKSTLDRAGAAVDVLYARTTPLTTDTLIRADAVGKYDAILLTNSMLLYQDATGGFVSALSPDQWNLLWAYERDYGVRQATLYSSYGSYPEDYCTRGVSEGGVGDTPLNANLSAAGGQIFDYLKSSATIPITQSYVYNTSIAAGCAATPVLTGGGNVLGVTSTSTDGRERMALTFTSNQYLMQSNLLVYGMFRWASRGLFLGEQRHYLNIDVDDWFNSSDHLFADGHLETDPGFSMSPHDAYNTSTQQSALRSRYPLGSGFGMGMAFNGSDAVPNAQNRCFPNTTTVNPSQFSSTTKCLATQLRWINHTYTHPKMNFTDYATSYTEINQNLTVAQQMGLPVDRTVLKTGEYSGLGTYNPDVNNDIDPPTDFGLNASNPNLLKAAKDSGVTYLHGNMSFPSQVPSCFNCGIVHPMETSLTIVPDWPTNVAFFSTNPDEETYFYNSYYGPTGKFPYWSRNLTFAEIIDFEAEVALSHLATGSIYSHTFHISNLHDYGAGRTLTTDWADKVLAKYSAYYNVPVLSPGWPALAQYVTRRNSHFAEVSGGVDAVWDKAANSVTVTSPAAGTVTVSGARTAGFSTYGTDVSAPITLTAGGSVSFTPSPRP